MVRPGERCQSDARAGKKVRELSGDLVHLCGMTVTTQSDEELGSLALEGNVAALAALFERYRPSLYASAIARMNDRADALDAVQDTFVVALLRLSDLRDVGAARAWLHAVLRNLCRMRIRRRREVPLTLVEPVDSGPGPEEALHAHVMREWVWHALDSLSQDERLTVMLRHFSRCSSYEAIARITAVPVGTVRSRLSRARSRLAEALMTTAASARMSHDGLESARRQQWDDFYRVLHESPISGTYQNLFASDVQVSDPAGRWCGIDEWSKEERAAITAGVRARVIGLLASRDITVLEIDFDNPVKWPNHCPPHATFVHRLNGGRSQRLRIHYPTVSTSYTPPITL
jgi:RNA polymerase sigma factor (sigma-70 family)